MQNWNDEIRKQLNNLPGFPEIPNTAPPVGGRWILGDWIGECHVRPEVANFAALPLTGNEVGDVRVSLAQQAWYIWDGAAWQAMGGGGGGGRSYLTLANNETTNTSGFELIGGFTLDASLYTTIRFITTAAVTNGALTGDLVLYNLTNAVSVITHTYTTTTPTQIVSAPLALPAGLRTYEVRQRVTGGSLVGDRIVTTWAGLSLE